MKNVLTTEITENTKIFVLIKWIQKLNSYKCYLDRRKNGSNFKSIPLLPFYKNVRYFFKTCNTFIIKVLILKEIKCFTCSGGKRRGKNDTAQIKDDSLLCLVYSRGCKLAPGHPKRPQRQPHVWICVICSLLKYFIICKKPHNFANNNPINL